MRISVDTVTSSINIETSGDAELRRVAAAINEIAFGESANGTPALVTRDNLRMFVRLYKEQSGDPIQNIKYVRCLTGWGLREAKEFVDEINNKPL